MKDFKIRFLLTGKCTAKCSYCHNEGQEKSASLLSFKQIKKILDELDIKNSLPSEVVLSGGEPTLHKNLVNIAKLCKSKNIYTSMASHIGHSKLLDPVLPYLDELKIHIDSFNPEEQHRSMGIHLNDSIYSINLAKKYPVKLVINHPLVDIEKMKVFVESSRKISVNCKIIEQFGSDNYIPISKVDWSKMGYFHNSFGILTYKDKNHKIFTKKCGIKSNEDKTLFIGSGSVKSSLKNDIDFFKKDILILIKNIINESNVEKTIARYSRKNRLGYAVKNSNYALHP